MTQRFFDQAPEVFGIQLFLDVIIVRQDLSGQYVHEVCVSCQPAQIVDGPVPRHGKDVGFRGVELGKSMAVDPKLDEDVLYDLFRCCRGFAHFKNKGGKMVEVRVIKGSECLFITF